MRVPEGADRRLPAARAAAFAIGLLSGNAAPAQVAGLVSFDTEARLRGYSLSSGDPVVAGALSYDDASGFYGNLAVSGVLDSGGPHLLGAQGSVGYARRVGPEASVDVGLLRTEYTRHASPGRATHYTEAYVGIAARQTRARISISPDYFRSDTPTLYLEAQHSLRLGQDWSLTGHAGSLIYVGSRPEFADDVNYDWQITLAKRWRAIEVHAALTGGGPGDDYYRGSVRDRTAFIAGASLAF